MTIDHAQCAACKCDLEVFPNAEPDPIAACPKCGLSDTFENVTREIMEYVSEQELQHRFDALINTTHRDKFIKVTPHFRPKGGYRFIVDRDFH